MIKLLGKIREINRVASEYGLNREVNQRIQMIIQDKLLRHRLQKSIEDSSLIEATHSAIFFKQLERRYAEQLEKTATVDNDWVKSEMPRVIWWCWLQGEDQAPGLVKECLKSLRHNLPDYDIQVITWDNLNNYIQVPKKILDKFNAKWINGANFSDIIRLMLLVQYGGIWVDSTVFCTDDRLIRAIEKKNMFMFQNVMTTNSNVIKMSSWMIASKKNNPYLEEVSTLLTQYYIDSPYTEDYFICHLLLSLFATKYQSIWDDMQLYNNINPHIMQYMMNKRYNEELFNRVTEKSSVHKLNHHISLATGNTFYHHLEELNYQ